MAVVKEGAADYLVHDALSELTLSILYKDQVRDPGLGYARDIEFLAAKVYPGAFQKGMRIVTNAGGLNPAGCARAVQGIFAKMGLKGLKIGVVTGDGLRNELADLLEEGISLTNMDTGEEFPRELLETASHANVYVGAESVKAALDQGAHLVITGRVADPSLTLGILAHAHAWKLAGDLSPADWNLLASGIAVGHLLECGGQASGGNSYAEWPMDYEVWNLGYPIAHVFEDGTAEFTKLESQGGKISRNTLREQLVYEIHNPAEYLTPDVTVDLTEIRLDDLGPNRVRMCGVKGRPRPEKLKMTLGFPDGYLSEQFFFFSWPHAYEKAVKFIDAVKKTWAGMKLEFPETEFSFVGINGIQGAAAPMPAQEVLAEMNEIGVRAAWKHADPKAGKLAFQSVIALALNGPPGLISLPGWGKQERMLLGLWPCLVPREAVRMEVEMLEL